MCGEPSQLHLHRWRQWPRLGSEGGGVHTHRGVHGVLVLTMMGVSFDVWWTFTAALTSVTAVAQIGKRGGWCAHSQGSARRPCADHDGCVIWCVVNLHSCTYIGDGSGPDWEARGVVCTLTGECTASLCWPWWVCHLMCGEPSQLHLHRWRQWPRLGSEGGGVHTHRRVHGVLVLTMMGVSVDVWWTSTVALYIDDGSRPDYFFQWGGGWKDQQWHLDAGSVYWSRCARWLCHLTNATCIQQDALLVWGGNSWWTLMPMLFLMLIVKKKWIVDTLEHGCGCWYLITTTFQGTFTVCKKLCLWDVAVIDDPSWQHCITGHLPVCIKVMRNW